MKSRIEIKIKWSENKLDKWEDIHISFSIEINSNWSNDLIDSVVQNRCQNKDIHQIRWNREGLEQGHYVEVIK